MRVRYQLVTFYSGGEESNTLERGYGCINSEPGGGEVGKRLMLVVGGGSQVTK